MSDIVQKLWGFCHTLRHDGIDIRIVPIEDSIEMGVASSECKPQAEITFQSRRVPGTRRLTSASYIMSLSPLLEKFIMKHLGPMLVVCLMSAAPLGAGEPGQNETIAYVRKLQTPTGGFLASAKAAPTLKATSAAVRALHYLGGDIPDKDACIKFVASCHDPASGGFADTPAGKPDVYATAVGLMAVVELKMPVEKYADGAVKFLSDKADTFEDVRIAVAGLEALKKKSPKNDKWRGDLAVRMNQDYSFGAGEPKVRARETGGSVVTLLRLVGAYGHETTILNVLNAGQRQSGGWGKPDDAAASDLESSYRVMRCYMMLKARPDNVAGLRSFIASCRNSDGGYGNAPGQPSSVAPTYFASIITHWLKEKK
jgi:hypothetical protein